MVLSVLLASALMAAYGYMTDLGDSMLRAMGNDGADARGRVERKKDGFDDFAGVYRRGNGIFEAGASAVVRISPFLWRCRRHGFWKMALDVSAKRGEHTGNPNESRICPLHPVGHFLTTLPLVLWNMFEIPVIGMGYNFFMIPLVSVLIPAALRQDWRESAGCR